MIPQHKSSNSNRDLITGKTLLELRSDALPDDDHWVGGRLSNEREDFPLQWWESLLLLFLFLASAWISISAVLWLGGW